MTHLADVKRAASAKSRADMRYRAAIVDAHHAGASYADIAKALGISRQAVRVLITRAA